MIELDKLTKRFGTKTAVDAVSMTIESGELFAFLGPNGAGKTTTIKMIAGLLRPDEGAVRVLGHDVVTDPVSAKAHLSYIPDEPYLYDKLSGREFLTFVARMHGIDRDQAEAKIEYLTRLLSLGEFLDQLTEEYSHGMKQRTVIAAGLVHEPDVMIVDEPMVGLDPKSSRVVKDLLRDLSGNGVTVFMSTHTLAVAEELADRIAVIHRGHLIALGTLQELYAISGGENGLEESFLTLTAEEETS